jgi:aerobic carbon-monoxide dehydrogenase medium subunit
MCFYGLIGIRVLQGNTMTINAHPTLPEFDYIQPETLTEASDFLLSHAAEACPFLGGTDVFVRMRDGLLAPKYLVDVKRLPEMNDLNFDPLSGLTIGAAVSMNRVIASREVQEHYPLLVEACRSVASYQLRNRATIVGNICNASPAGDTIGASLAFEGVLDIHGPGGMYQEALANFFLGPGKTKLKSGDVAIALRLPPPNAGSKGIYSKLGRNKLSDLSIVGVTVLGYPEPTVSGYRFRLILASVAPVPFVAKEAEAYLANIPITPDSICEAARLAAETCIPIDDVRGSIRYRKQMVKHLSARALSEVWQKLRN